MAEQPDNDREAGHTDPLAGDADQPRGLLYISDVQALQRAEVVSFHAADGVGLIHADLTAWSGNHTRIYTAKEQQLFPDAVGRDRRRRVEVPADIAGYDSQRRWHDHALPGATAFATIGGAPFDDVWRTAAATLRVGDIVRLGWRADNNTDQLIALGLHRDELSILVRRGKRQWTFLLDVSIRPQATRTITGPVPD
jgi:hypothetical protein